MLAQKIFTRGLWDETSKYSAVNTFKLAAWSCVYESCVCLDCWLISMSETCVLHRYGDFPIQLTGLMWENFMFAHLFILTLVCEHDRSACVKRSEVTRGLAFDAPFTIGPPWGLISIRNMVVDLLKANSLFTWIHSLNTLFTIELKFT